MLCIVCKTEIPDGALLCSVCKSYQRPWRNWISYLGTNAAVVTLILGGITYIGRSVASSIAKWTEHDGFQIAYLSSRGTNGIINVGDHDVIVLEETLKCDPFTVEQGLSLNRKVAARDLFTFDDDSSSPWGINAASMAKTEPASNRELMFLDNNAADRMISTFPSLRIFPGTVTLRYFSMLDKKQELYTLGCKCFIVNDPTTKGQTQFPH